MPFWNIVVGLTWAVALAALCNGLDTMMKNARIWLKILVLITILVIIIIGPK